LIIGFQASSQRRLLCDMQVDHAKAEAKIAKAMFGKATSSEK
jgi:hypothetical protein